jgi:hypothetical protein
MNFGTKADDLSETINGPSLIALLHAFKPDLKI